MIDNRNRSFHYAVLVSLALHALLLFAFPDLIDTARRAASIPPQIIARLMEPDLPAPALPVEKPPAKAERETPVKKAEKKTEKKSEKNPVLAAPQPAPAPAPPPEAVAPAAPPSPPVAAIDPQPAAPPQAAPSESPPVSPPPAEAQGSAHVSETLSQDQYRLLLINAAGRIKKQIPYPPIARENNWVGQVPLRVQVATNGRAVVTLRGSSGYEPLDRHGLQLFSQAAREVPGPQALRGKEFVVEVRAIYDLTE